MLGTLRTAGEADARRGKPEEPEEQHGDEGDPEPRSWKPPGHHMEGVEAAHAIRASHPQVGVVLLSQHADAAYALALLQNGAAGLAYLLKDRLGDLDELLRALREVVAGRSLIDASVVERLVAQRTRTETSPLSGLIPRELDVLRQMAQGKTNRAIGQALHLSESAVEKHVSAIFGKLRLASEPSVDRRVTAVLTFLRDTAETREPSAGAA